MRDMQSFIEKITELSRFNWQGGAYQWFFYAGILLVLIFEKRRMARIIFGWVPIAYLLCIYNPVFMSALEFAEVGDKQYFVRMFSFMPLMYTIARGIVCVLEKAKGWIKLLLVCMTCVLLCCTGKCIYQESWFVQADNYAKVSKDTYEVIEAIQGEKGENVSVATIEPVANYMRQVADFITPYARKMGRLGLLLSMDPPDVDRVMKMAGEQDLDYVLAKKTDATINAFAEHGYKTYALTSHLAVFKVTDVPRIKLTLDERRQIRAKTSYDAQGKAVTAKEGYTTVLYDYDNNRHRIREAYLDENGDIFSVSGGYASIHWIYSSRGLMKSQIYCDSEGKKILYAGRYETRFDYNQHGKIIRETYYNADGLLMNRMDTFYACKKIEYNSEGRVTKESYYDTEGNPALCSGGYASLERVYDKKGNIVREQYRNEKGERSAGNDGYAEIRREYNDANKVIYESYWNANDTPYSLEKGYHAVAREYDDAGNKTEEYWLASNGGETIRKEGYSRISREYNDNGKIIRESYYIYSFPCTLKDGFAYKTREYDQNGNMVSEAYFDEEGNPVMRKAGYAAVYRAYDQNNRMIRESYMDANGQPVKNKQGYAVLVRELDRRGWVVRESYLDEEEQPISNTAGYCVLEYIYNSFGDIIQENYLDAYGNPVQCSQGYDGIRREYNDERQLVMEIYLKDGVAINNSEGYATLERIYDGWTMEKEIKKDADGNPV